MPPCSPQCLHLRWGAPQSPGPWIQALTLESAAPPALAPGPAASTGACADRPDGIPGAGAGRAHRACADSRCLGRLQLSGFWDSGKSPICEPRAEGLVRVPPSGCPGESRKAPRVVLGQGQLVDPAPSSSSLVFRSTCLPLALWLRALVWSLSSGRGTGAEVSHMGFQKTF